MTQAVATSQPHTSTPILDRVRPIPAPPKKAKSTLKNLLLGGLIGALGTLLVLLPDYSSGPMFHVKVFVQSVFGRINPLLFMLLLLPLEYVAVFVHECGHLLAGTMVGFRVDHMRVGRLLFRPPFKVSFERYNLSGHAAHAAVVPLKSEGLRYKMLIFTLGGISANLVTGALAVWLYRQTQHSVFGCYAFLSLLQGILNLLPLTRKASVFDGRRVWMLLFDRPQGDRWLAMIQLLTAMVQGTPPEKCDPQLVRQATALIDRSPDTVNAQQLGYTVAYHSGNDDEAARCLENSMAYGQLAGPALREGFPFQAATFQARKRKNVPLAREWLQDAPQKPMVPALRLNAEAAILEAEGHIDEALKKIDESMAQAHAIKEDARRRMSVMFLEKWKAEITSANLSAPAEVRS